MAVIISEREIEILRSEAIRIATRRGFDLIPWPGVGVVAIDAHRDAYTIRFWRPTHEDSPHHGDRVGRFWIDAEALVAAKKNEDAFRALVQCEIGRALDAYEAELK